MILPFVDFRALSATLYLPCVGVCLIFLQELLIFELVSNLFLSQFTSVSVLVAYSLCGALVTLTGTFSNYLQTPS